MTYGWLALITFLLVLGPIYSKTARTGENIYLSFAYAVVLSFMLAVVWPATLCLIVWHGVVSLVERI